MIAPVVRYLISEVIILRAAVPLCLADVDAVARAFGAVFKHDVVEHIKLVLGADDHSIGNAQLAHILGRALCNVAGILIEGAVFGVVDYHDVADHGQGRNLGEAVDSRRIEIRNEHHIAALDRSVAVVGAVEADAVGHGVLVKALDRNTEVAPSAVDIGHLEVDHFDVVFLAHCKYVLKSFCHHLPPNFIVFDYFNNSILFEQVYFVKV